jgi:hypothetical protein
MKIKHAAGLLVAIALASASSLQAQITNRTLYNFDTDQVASSPYLNNGVGWGNWFGGVFAGVNWDASNDASNNPASGALQLHLTFPGGDQYVLRDEGNNGAPSYGPVDLGTWTNLSFDIRYDETSTIRTNTSPAGQNGSLGVGSLDYGYMRWGSRSPSFAQDWIYYFAISATNGAGQPNTNWTHISIDLRQVAQNYSDLSGGLLDMLFGMDAGAYGNAPLNGSRSQTLWIDNIKLTGAIPHPAPPTLSIQKATPPALWMFGGSGQYGRSQVALKDTSATWINATFPVTYAFTILDNATSPGALQTGIQFIGGNPGDQSFWDYSANNVLWLRIVSGTTNTTAVADVSWKTNGPNSNPDQHNIALQITNSVLAGTWKLTFLSNTNGTLTAPGAAAVPFSLALSDSDAQNAFNSPIQVRFGHENFGNPANGGVPHYWANILVTNTASGQTVNEDFTKEGSTQLDTNVWNLNTGDGNGLINLVPTNAPYWVKWTLPDSGFTLITGPSLPALSNWNSVASTTPIAQGGVRWQLVPSESISNTPTRFFGLVQRTFTQLQVLFPGETNAPNTPTGKTGTPSPISFGNDNGAVNVTVNAVDPSFHIVNTAGGNVVSLTSSDTGASIPPGAPLVNGTLTQQVFFSAPGSYTVTATNNTVTMPAATSSSITVSP